MRGRREKKGREKGRGAGGTGVKTIAKTKDDEEDNGENDERATDGRGRRSGK